MECNEEYLARVGVSVSDDNYTRCLTIMQSSGENRWWLSDQATTRAYYQTEELTKSGILLLPNLAAYLMDLFVLLKHPVFSYELIDTHSLFQRVERAWQERETTSTEPSGCQQEEQSPDDQSSPPPHGRAGEREPVEPREPKQDQESALPPAATLAHESWALGTPFPRLEQWDGEPRPLHEVTTPPMSPAACAFLTQHGCTLVETEAGVQVLFPEGSTPALSSIRARPMDTSAYACPMAVSCKKCDPATKNRRVVTCSIPLPSRENTREPKRSVHDE